MTDDRPSSTGQPTGATALTPRQWQLLAYVVLLVIALVCAFALLLR